MSGRRVRRRTKLIAAGIALFMIAAVGLFLWHIDGPRVVARTVAPDGTEFCVVQTCNWDLDELAERSASSHSRPAAVLIV